MPYFMISVFVVALIIANFVSAAAFNTVLLVGAISMAIGGVVAVVSIKKAEREGLPM